MLTDIQVRTLKPKDKRFEIRDGTPGLILRVSTNGNKKWLFKAMINRKSVFEVLGDYPYMTLAEARQASIQRMAELKTKNEEKVVTVKQAYEEWFKEKQEDLRHPNKVEQMFSKHILPAIGDYNVKDVDDSVLRKELDYLEKAGTIDTLGRVISKINELFRFCYSQRYLTEIKTMYARSRFKKKPKAKHRNAVKPDKLSFIFQAFKEGAPSMVVYLKWSAYTALRPKENAELKWEYVNWEDNTIKIPGDEMKEDLAHTLPISRQMKEILEHQKQDCELMCQPIEILETDSEDEKAAKKDENEKRNLMRQYIWFSDKSTTGHISSQTLAHWFQKLKLNHIQTAHGLRRVARTYFSREHVSFEVAEAYLAHKKGDPEQEIYDAEDYFEERKEIMQQWCDYVDEQCNLLN